MKRKITYSLIAIIAILLPSISDAQQKQPKDSNITLTVDTENISDENKYDEGMVIISDDRGATPATGRRGIRSFTTRIDASQNVTWKGIPKESSTGDQVLITKVVRKRSFASRRRLERDDYDGERGVVRARARRRNGIGFKHQYFIHLEIKSSGASKKIVLDPKLRARRVR